MEKEGGGKGPRWRFQHKSGERIWHALKYQLSITDADFWKALNEDLSVAMSMTLRHDARDMGLPIDDQGFVYIPDLLAHPRFSSLQYTQEHIERQAQLNSSHDKNPFLLKGNYIAGRTGHTVHASQQLGSSSSNTRVSNAPLLATADVPPVLCHGTIEKHLDGILRLGVLATERDSHWQHPAYTSLRGFWRNSITVSVDILAQKAAEDGISFYLSDNSVYLCKETLPVKYIYIYIGLAQNQRTYALL